MLSEFNPALADSFIAVARARGMLKEAQASELTELSSKASVMPSQLAVEMGMLTPVDVEVVEAFLAPRDLAPGYELLDVVGYGALGVVYRARQPHLHRDVAIKAILQSRLSQQNVVARFEQEGALIGRLQHPNIVSAYDFGSHRNRLYLVMELVSGVDLSQRAEEGPMPLVNALSIVRQTASGLAHALSHRIIHRDIKPGNLLLTDAPTGFDLPSGAPLVKIADFGLARFHRSAEMDDQDTRLTMTGAALGTPMYCAPEQLSGDEIDHRSDIYALGATFFRILTGDTPFASDKVSKIIAAKVTGQLPRLELLPDDLNPAVKELLLDMMKADPDARVQDYETLIARIDAIDEGLDRVMAVGTKRKPHEELSQGRSLKRMHPANRRVILAVSAMVVFASLLFALPYLKPGPVSPTMIPSGWETHLFDGKTMAGWMVRGGLWKSGTDSEGGSILIGKGSAVRPLPSQATADVQTDSGIGVRVGVDLQGAESAEIHFAFQGQDIPKAQRAVVMLAAGGVGLGTKATADAKFTPLGSSLDMPAVDGDQPRYHEVRVERQGATWFAFFDDKQLGAFSSTPVDNMRFVQLIANGTVHFEGPIVYQLNEPAGPAPLQAVTE